MRPVRFLPRECEAWGRLLLWFLLSVLLLLALFRVMRRVPEGPGQPSPLLRCEQESETLTP
jgi:hypothetical protein